MSDQSTGRLELLRDLMRAAQGDRGDVAQRLTEIFPSLETFGVEQLGSPLHAADSPMQFEPPGGATPGLSSFSALAANTAVLGGTALFAVRSARPVWIRVDGDTPVPMRAVAGSVFWIHQQRVEAKQTHSFEYLLDGRTIGGGDVAGYRPESEQDDGPSGRLGERREVTSSIFPGAVTDYWIYTNPGVDPDIPAPLMVWHDGAGYVGHRDLTGHRLQIVSDNLVRRGLIPPMVHLLVQPSRPAEVTPVQYPGQPPQVAMRSLQYDTVSDRYGRHLIEEVLPHASQVVNVRSDGYSRGSAGLSSGGICAFTLAWFHPESFTRVHSGIGSFTGLQHRPDQHLEGGYIYPQWIRENAPRNLRVWLSDGINDIEVDRQSRADIFTAGSWPLANLQMANSLKLSGYDFHFRYGTAGHNHAQTALDLPESLAWLWRGYDATLTSVEFEQEAAERRLPPFRASVANRSAW